MNNNEKQVEEALKCGCCDSVIPEATLLVAQKTAEGEGKYTPMCNMECLAKWSFDQTVK